MKTLFFIFIFLILSTFLTATIINVPGDQPTIQAGIDVAIDADTVLVQPGTYVENINYIGKDIVVGSLYLTTQDTSYISQTIIDGNHNGSVVTFVAQVDSSAALCGFTIINGNHFSGGGIFCSTSEPKLDNLVIMNNVVTALQGDGGGVFLYNSNPSLINIIIKDNSTIGSQGNGGGIYCYNSNPILENVTITNNYAGDKGGGIYCTHSSSPSLENVTISDNSAISGGGIYCTYSSSPSLINSILWNDSPPEIYINSGSVTATYSDIQGGWTGIGNIDADPLFVDPVIGDYHLTENSPCIDAGDPTSPLDPDGTIADMGAFYYDQGSDVDDNEIQIVEFNLSNYPNPFNPITFIRFDIKEHETGILTIFNIKGQMLESHQFESGKHNYLWDASDQASGIYFYKLQTQTITKTRKMLLLK